MYIGFRKFLGVLGIVGVALGIVFGSGVAVGRGQTTLAAPAAATGVAAAGGGASGSGGLAAAAANGAAGGGSGDGLVTGSVESVTPTSLVVKTAAGQNVALTVNAQTMVRRIEAGALQDLKAGEQVVVTRDASSVATGVQVVPPGVTLPGGGAGRGGAGASGSAIPSGTAPAKGTPLAR